MIYLWISLEHDIAGSSGNDILHGNVGDDMVQGGSGNDQISGDDGNDVLTWSTGADHFDCGSVTDRITVLSTRYWYKDSRLRVIR